MNGWRNESRVAVNFTDLPPAALNPGRAIRCNPLVTGQPYFWMESDGEFWRPLCGAQVLYTLGAAIIGDQANPAPQLMLSVPIPPGLMPDLRSMLRTVVGVDHLGGTADNLSHYIKVGTTQTWAGDNIIHQATTNAAVWSGGATNQLSRNTATTVSKHGGGGASSAVSLSVYSGVARAPLDVIVGDLDTETNYLTIWHDLGTGGLGEYGQLHAFTLELIG
jgi:hypothetical protein